MLVCRHPSFLENIWYFCCALLAQSLQRSCGNDSPGRFGCESAILRRQQLSLVISKTKFWNSAAKWDWVRAIFVNQSEWRTLRILPDAPYRRPGTSGYDLGVKLHGLSFRSHKNYRLQNSPYFCVCFSGWNQIIKDLERAQKIMSGTGERR